MHTAKTTSHFLLLETARGFLLVGLCKTLLKSFGNVTGTYASFSRRINEFSILK